MPEIFNNLSLKDRRRELRKNQTVAEKELWNNLRRKQIMNIRFCRQYGIGFYIADFYAPAIRLAIEIDGKQHEYIDEKMNDEARDECFRSLNIKVLRFKNDEIFNDLENVLIRIKSEIMNLNPPQPSCS